MGYRAEYRLAHWSGHRIVRDSDGEPVPFSHPSDAAIAAAALVQALNSKPAFWRGGSRDDAREAAEKFFARAADGSEAEIQAEGQIDVDDAG